MGRRKPKATGDKINDGNAKVRTLSPEAAGASPWRHAHWVVLGVLFAFVLFSRIGTFSLVYHKHPSLILSPDSVTYDNPARALLKNGRFASNPDHPEVPEFVRTPGYPLFIAAHYLLFGIDYAPVIITQILLSAVATVVIFLLCLRLYGPRVALFAVILMALEPISFLYSQVLLTDMLFALLVALIAAAGVRLIRAHDTGVLWAWLLGLAIAGSAHLRPVSYYLIAPVMAGILAVKRIQACPLRQLLKLGTGLAVPWLVFVGGWQVRNAVEAGSAEFSAIQSVNLLLYRAAGVVALRDGIAFEEARKKVVTDLGEREKLPPAERYRVYRREALKIMRENPWLTLKMMSGGLSSLLFTSPDDELKSYIGQPFEVSLFRQWWSLTAGQFYDLWIRQHFRALLINLLFMWPLSGLLYLGLVFAPWCRLRGGGQRVLTPEAIAVHLYLVGLILYLAIVSAGPEASYRFRLPLVPVLAIYSAIGWDQVARGLGIAWRSWRSF